MSKREEKRQARYEKVKAKSQEDWKRVSEKQSPSGKPAPKPGEKK